MTTHSETPTLYCLLILRSLGTYQSLYERFFPSLSSMPHYLLSPHIDYWCHTLVLHIYMVGIVVFLVLYDWIGLMPCSHIQAWIRGLVASCSHNQMLVPHIFFHSNPRWFRNFLLELSQSGGRFLLQHNWRQNFQPLGLNWLGAMRVSKNQVLPCFVYTRVFEIFVLKFMC